MKVTCNNCKKVLNVPDEKIPEDKDMTFNCPGCKNPVTVSKRGKSPLDETQNVPVPSGRPPEDTANLAAIMESMESEMDMLEEGSKRALIACDKGYDIIAKLLKKMQYTISRVETQKDGLDKLTANDYELVILGDRFGGAEPGGNAIHKYLDQMTMDTRRRMFVTLIGANLKSLDNMTAFVNSVNMVMNENDFGNFELMLKKAINENDTFFHVLKRMLVETGKEVAL